MHLSMLFKLNKLKFILWTLVAATILPVAAIQAQEYTPSEERSDFLMRRKSIMAGNRLRATYVNAGHAGKWDGANVDELMFEFPANTDRRYMYFATVIIGAEVRDQASPDENPRFFPIVNAANGKQDRAGNSWTVNPITGYARMDSDEIARSDRGPSSSIGNTWPDFWPDKQAGGGDGWAGSWNGFFGRDQFNADIEFYYKAGDDLYTRYNGESRTLDKYQPDNTDPSRGGLGMILDGRILAWSQTLVNSTHFNIYEIKNDASFDYDKVAFGIWIADLVAENASNDIPQFDILQAIAYLTDADRNLPPPSVDFGGPIGEMGLKFLETPGNSTDGIDNDGDSDTYNGQGGNAGIYYLAKNVDLYRSQLVNFGGFYTLPALVDSVIPPFRITDFQSRELRNGDKIVLIQEDGSRVVQAYQGGTSVVSQGRTIYLPPNGLFVNEDIFDETDPNFGFHIDLLDNDLDGLIDENRPNNLEKTTFFGGVQITRPVRYINYLNFSIGDTIQAGLSVSNQMIREKIASDASFAALVQDNEGRFINVHTAAPMIDEARNDFFDNDQDWLAISDDIGIEGDPDFPSEGAGNGIPSSGEGTSFPGEPNIDKTDVSESDIIGVTRATIFSAGQLNTMLDANVWDEYLLPGAFDDTGVLGEDSDIFVSSSLFPLKKGQVERFALAITAAQTGQSAANDRRVIDQNLREAQNAYEADYQFATAPLAPKVTAIPGDGYVMLYWDDVAESSFDRYLSRITGEGNDFEGYKVYRTTDDFFSLGITDAYGNGQFVQPIAQFDIKNGISDLHPVPINGTQFNLGTDNGIRRVYIDRNVVNGKNYFYAVTSYDYGATIAGIAPAESPVQLSRNPDGSFILGDNVVQVRPAPSVAGYIDPLNPVAQVVAGSPTGEVRVNIIDPSRVKNQNTYRVVFEDSLYESTDPSVPDTLRTKNFSLLDITNGVDTLISKSTEFNGEDVPEIDGFKLELANESRYGISEDQSQWIAGNSDTREIFPFSIRPATSKAKLNDYIVVFGELGFGQSSDRRIERSPNRFQSYPSRPTNFKIFSTYETDPQTGEPLELEYAYFAATRFDIPGSKPVPLPEIGNFSSFVTGGIFNPNDGTVESDDIYIIEDYLEELSVATYRIRMAFNDDGRNPAAGDTLRILTNKPFTANDVFEFKIDENNLAKVDNEVASEELDDIKVVPNPYIVSNPYEPKLNLTNRNQRRELHFTHLPIPCELKIFNVSGQLIRTITINEGDSRVFNGTYVWNMLTKDNLEIAYGVYIYHVDAPGVGRKTGKFAVIK